MKHKKSVLLSKKLHHAQPPISLPLPRPAAFLGGSLADCPVGFWQMSAPKLKRRPQEKLRIPLGNLLPDVAPYLNLHKSRL